MSAFLQSMTQRISNSPSIPGKVGYVALLLTVGSILSIAWVAVACLKVFAGFASHPSKRELDAQFLEELDDQLHQGNGRSNKR